MSSSEEIQLVKCIIDGDTHRFEEVVQQYQAMVFTIAVRILNSREEAEDVAQEVFVRVYQNLERYNAKARLSTWIYRIAYNAALDRARKLSRTGATTLEEGHYHDLHVEDVSTTVELKERNAHIKDCVNDLPATESIALSLFYFKELSVKEVAEIMEISEENVKVKLFRGRKRLKEQMIKFVRP